MTIIVKPKDLNSPVTHVAHLKYHYQNMINSHTHIYTEHATSKIEKVPRGIRGEKSSKEMASSRNLVSTIGALASPEMGDGTRCPEG